MLKVIDEKRMLNYLKMLQMVWNFKYFERRQINCNINIDGE